MDEKKQPGVNCTAIILKSSKFDRNPDISKKPKMVADLTLNVGLSEDKKKSTVVLGGVFKFLGEADKPFAEAAVEFVGLFSIDEINPNMDLETFSNKNAPAIIFPYLRQHIHTLTLCSGMTPILLPPINILAVLEEKTTKKPS